MMSRALGATLQSISTLSDKCFPAFRRGSQYHSEVSLKVLYPNSQLNIQTPSPPQKAQGKFNGLIPMNNLRITYACSSGQNVNRVKTKVQLQFNIEDADWIPTQTRQRLLQEHRSRINKDGDFVIRNDQTRSQQMNLAAALNRLRNMLWELEKEPNKSPEETLESIRRRHENAAKQRLVVRRN